MHIQCDILNEEQKNEVTKREILQVLFYFNIYQKHIKLLNTINFIVHSRIPKDIQNTFVHILS